MLTKSGVRLDALRCQRPGLSASAGAASQGHELESVNHASNQDHPHHLTGPDPPSPPRTFRLTPIPAPPAANSRSVASSSNPLSCFSFVVIAAGTTDSAAF